MTTGQYHTTRVPPFSRSVRRNWQIPTDLVVKSQAIDIAEINSSRIRRPNAVPMLCRNRISRFAQLSTSEAHWSTTKSDGMWKCIFNAGLIPNIKENPRNRKHPKRGRKRLFNAAIHALRLRVERTVAWEDKFKRLLLRFERIQQRYYGLKLLAHTLINLRAFCGT
jgi:hypothetical protein